MDVPNKIQGEEKRTEVNMNRGDARSGRQRSGKGNTNSKDEHALLAGIRRHKKKKKKKKKEGVPADGEDESLEIKTSSEHTQ